MGFVSNLLNQALKFPNHPGSNLNNVVLIKNSNAPMPTNEATHIIITTPKNILCFGIYFKMLPHISDQLLSGNVNTRLNFVNKFLLKRLELYFSSLFFFFSITTTRIPDGNPFSSVKNNWNFCKSQGKAEVSVLKIVRARTAYLFLVLTETYTYWTVIASHSNAFLRRKNKL